MLALDVILIILTSLCIVYCTILNRRIVQVQKYREDMLNIFKEFDNSIVKAEKTLSEAKNIFPETEKTLSKLSEKSEKHMSKFDNMLKEADKLAEELETIIISGNKLFSRLKELEFGVTDYKDNQADGQSVAQLTPQKKEKEIKPNEFTTKIRSPAPEFYENEDKIRLTQQDYYELIQNKRRGAL